MTYLILKNNSRVLRSIPKFKSLVEQYQGQFVGQEIDARTRTISVVMGNSVAEADTTLSVLIHQFASDDFIEVQVDRLDYYPR
jgi:hypothetical protein